MISLEIDIQTAAALRSALFREQDGYTLDISCCPPRIVNIRNLILDIDSKIEAELREQEKIQE